MPDYGLPQEYGNQLFTNIQSAANNLRGARRQNVMDNTSRFGQNSGAQLGALQGADQATADQSLQAATGAQLEGTREAMTDRRTAQQQKFTADQAAMNRQLQTKMAQDQLDASRYQFDETQNYNNTWGKAQSIAGFMGGIVNPLITPSLTGLGNKMAYGTPYAPVAPRG